MALQITRDGDDRYRVTVIDGRTVGFVHKWYLRDTLNETGVPRFRAAPLCQPTHDCESLSSAMKYLEAFA